MNRDECGRRCEWIGVDRSGFRARPTRTPTIRRRPSSASHRRLPTLYVICERDERCRERSRISLTCVARNRARGRDPALTLTCGRFQLQGASSGAPSFFNARSMEIRRMSRFQVRLGCLFATYRTVYHGRRDHGFPWVRVRISLGTRSGPDHGRAVTLSRETHDRP